MQETQRQGETVGRQDKERDGRCKLRDGETQSQRQIQRQGGAPTPPSSAPDTADKGSPFPPARPCQAPDNAPLSWLQSRQLEGRLGPGGRGSHQEAELWPLPSDSTSSSWPRFLVSAYSHSACMEHLLCVPEMPPCLSWHSLVSCPFLCPLLVLPVLLAPFLGGNWHLLSS